MSRIVASLAALRVGSPPLTAAFWGSVVVFSACYWVARFPPAIDYPQHLAMGALLHRLWSGSEERALLEWVPLTYNGGFHVVVALLCHLVPAEVAGKLVLSTIPPLTAGAALALLAVHDRPRWYAFAALPFAWSNVVGWGFVNYALGVPLAMLLLAAWLRWDAGSRRHGAWLAVGGLVLAYTHVLATLCFLVSVTLAWLGGRTPREVGWTRWLAGGVRGALPLVPGVAFCLLVWWSHREAPNIYWEDKDGQDWPAWHKARHFLRFAVGNAASYADQWVFAGLLLLVLAIALSSWWGRERREDDVPPRQFRVLSVAWLALYFLTPLILMSTWFIYERLPVWWLCCTLPALPRVSDALARRLAPLMAGLGVGASLVALVSFARLPDQEDADRILDDIPAGARVFAVMHDNTGHPGVFRNVFVHHLAYALARRPVEIAYTFTKFASLPVRYREGHRPPLIPGGLEWTPGAYDHRAGYARRYPLVLVRTPWEAPDEDPAARTFEDAAERVRVVARRGRFWLYDATAAFDEAEAGGRVNDR